MRGFLIGLSLAVSLVCGSASADTLYTCNYQDSRPKEADKFDLFIQFDPKTESATAMDAIAYDKVRHPDLVPTKVTPQGGGVYMLTWTINDVRKQSASSDLSYVAFLDTKANTVDITISPISYPKNWRYLATCATEKVK